MNTPASGIQELIGIVGYPFDLEDGKYMYEHFLRADWNLATAERSMLEYSIDTCRGKPAIDVTVLFDSPGIRSIGRCSTATSVRQKPNGAESTPKPASFE